LHPPDEKAVLDGKYPAQAMCSTNAVPIVQIDVKMGPALLAVVRRRRDLWRQVRAKPKAQRFTQTINAVGCGDPVTSGHIALPSPNVTTDP
jgi:hypothetical protein